MPVPFAKVASTYSSINFSSLVSSLKEKGTEEVISSGEIIIPESERVMVVLDGKFIISDSREAGLLLGESFQFMPLGLIENYYPVSLCYMAEGDVKVVTSSKSDFDNIFFQSKKNLDLLLNIITHMMTMLIFVYYERNSIDGYDIIRNMIPRYLNQNMVSTSQREDVVEFITRRTKLSAKYVHEILLELCVSNYIVFENGNLKSIIKDIPERKSSCQNHIK